MVGPVFETEAKRILNRGISQGISQTEVKTAIRMLKGGKLTIEEIAEYSGMSVEEVEKLAGLEIV